MGLNYDLWDKSENLRRINYFENLIRLIDIFLQKNARFLEYHLRSLTFKIGDNLI